MRVLLIKPETVGIFSWTAQVEHEPLELEYLYTVLKNRGHKAFIYDRRHDLTPLKAKLLKVRPKVVCITGYITQEPLMKKLTHAIKQFNPAIKVVIGGSHAEINYRNFYTSEADYIYHLSGLKYFSALMDYLAGKPTIPFADLLGICYREKGQWVYREKLVESPEELPIPDRSYFYRHQNLYRYMTFHPLALIKNSYSCPNACTFCYCTNRNGGNYRFRSVENLVNEIASLKVENIHITDDNFLSSPVYLEEFIRLLKERNIHKKYLIYGTADFIANHEELMKQLAEVGLALVMVGLEATNDKVLDAYHKKANVENNEECIRILHKYHIICSGLFIVQQEMERKDFKKLYQWIARRPIVSTISVFTPMQGAANYDEYKDRILTTDIRKQDLFHCILKPKHMSTFEFHLRYYLLSFASAYHKRKVPLMSGIGLADFTYALRVLRIKCRRRFLL